MLLFFIVGSSPMPEDATIQNILENYDDHEEKESGAMELAKLMPLLFCVKFWGIEFFAWTDKLL